MPGFAALPWIVLAAASAPSGPTGAQCPSDEQLRHSLGVEGKDWRVACNATKKDGVEVAALLPPTTPTGSARVVVSVVQNERRVRSETFLDGPERGYAATRSSARGSRGGRISVAVRAPKRASGLSLRSSTPGTRRPSRYATPSASTSSYS